MSEIRKVKDGGCFDDETYLRVRYSSFKEAEAEVRARFAVSLEWHPCEIFHCLSCDGYHIARLARSF